MRKPLGFTSAFGTKLEKKKLRNFYYSGSPSSDNANFPQSLPWTTLLAFSQKLEPPGSDSFLPGVVPNPVLRMVDSSI
jgi:hypothetical protein